MDDRTIEKTVNGMKMSVRVPKGPKGELQVRFTGTPPGGHLLPGEVFAWMNHLRALIDEARELRASRTSSQ